MLFSGKVRQKFILGWVPLFNRRTAAYSEGGIADYSRGVLPFMFQEVNTYALQLRMRDH